MQQKNEDKNGQLVTDGIFYCRGGTDFSFSASNKLSCNPACGRQVAKIVLRNRQQKHTGKPLPMK
jgi:hypothetical protein